MILLPDNDPIGQAVHSFYFKKDNTPIAVCSDVVEDELLPPDYFFRSFNEMPKLERIAMKMCQGSVLDIGAGAGCHSVHLQSKKIDVTALEISELCCNLLEARGIKKVVNSDIVSFTNMRFDTILLLMNGIGIAGTLRGLKDLLVHLKSLLNLNGRILFDSSDLMYLYEDEDGSFLFDINSQNYYGEISYELKYKDTKALPFSWLFVDNVLVSELASEVGFSMKVVEYGPHYDYLAELKLL